jgi:hypothetical protein
LRTMRRVTVRPSTCGSMPRRVVSTSGSSGIDGSQNICRAALAAATDSLVGLLTDQV